MRSGSAAAVYVLSGGKDFSNGALYWHGKYFFTSGWAAYRNEYMIHGFSWSPTGLFKGRFTPESQPTWACPGITDRPYIGVATQGRTIFMTH